MSATLLDRLRQLTEKLRAAHVRHALIGGLAVAAHGYNRATRDIDFLIDGDDADAVRELMSADGFEVLDFRPDVSSYVRHFERVDFLHANRRISRRLLAEAAGSPSWNDVPLVSVEGLIGLKVQALADDPRRHRDMIDIEELLKRHRERLDMAEVREYFALFDRESLLDDTLAHLD